MYYTHNTDVSKYIPGRTPARIEESFLLKDIIRWLIGNLAVMCIDLLMLPSYKWKELVGNVLGFQRYVYSTIFPKIQVV